MANIKFKDCQKGDTLYLLDFWHNFEIKKVLVEEIRCWYGESSLRFKVKGYNEIPGCINARSRSNNLFTTIEEATEFKEEIDKGKRKTLFTAKKGDYVYVILSASDEIKKVLVEDKVNSQLIIDLNGKRQVYINDAEMEDRISGDYYKKGNFVKFRIFLNEADAEKCIKEAAKRQKKNATLKYIKSIENYDGKPLRLTDNAKNDLRYGDIVVYIRRVGYSNTPELRIGKIVGETKTKIAVLDEEEKLNGKRQRWGNGVEKTDGKHLVDTRSVMLFKAAEVNTKSGFVFTK